MMRRLFAAFSRYRPRALTVLLLAAVASTIVLANSSEEIRPRNIDQATFLPESELRFDLREPIAGTSTNEANVSYGWPLVWRQYVLALARGSGVIGEAYSPGRLAGNAAIWLVILLAPAGACEWLLRRYRPRWRFSLRTMLAVVGFAAALCAWFATVRNRANVQDPLVAAIDSKGGRVWVESWGPKWLGDIGADRFRRNIVGVALNVPHRTVQNDFETERLLDKLKGLPKLQYLSLTANRLSPEMTRALGEMRRLESLLIKAGELPQTGQPLGDAIRGMPRIRVLSVESGPGGASHDLMSHECLAAIGSLAELEHLYLGGWTIASQDLTSLTGLVNLRSLVLDSLASATGQPDPDPPFLSGLPALPQLESLVLLGTSFDDRDLHFVAGLPRLNSLDITYCNVHGTGIAELAPLGWLEELAISRGTLSAAGFESLLKLKRLRCLHLEGFNLSSLPPPEALRNLLSHLPEDEVDDCLQGLEELLKSNPKLAIDGDLRAFNSPAERTPANWETLPDRSFGALAREAVRRWNRQQAGE